MNIARHRFVLAAIGAAALVTASVAVAATQGGSPAPAGSSVRIEKKVTDPSAAVVAAAKREGSVTFYASALTDQIQNLVKAFEKKYGITVNSQFLGAAPLATRMNAELTARHVTADVIDIADHDLCTKLADRDAFASLTTLPEYRTFPKHFKYKLFAIDSVQAFGVGYNTQQVSANDLKSWAAAVNPRFKGRIVILDPRTIPISQSFFVLLDKKLGDDFIRKIAALNPTVELSSTPTSQLIVAGEALVGFPINPSSVPSLKAAGAPYGVVEPSPTTGPVHYAALMKAAPHPNAARLFMNYLLSNSGQAAYNGNGYGSSAVRNIRGLLALPKGYSPPTPPSPDAVKKVVRLLGLG